jgi:hypothetical protein
MIHPSLVYSTPQTALFTDEREKEREILKEKALASELFPKQT